VAYTSVIKDKSAAAPIQSVSGYYLPYEGKDSKIFIVSANANYGSYPYPTHTTFNGSLVENGEPCIIINVTIRDDYSTQYPPPNPNSYDSTLVYVYLTAQIFSGENQIPATDLLMVGMPPDGGTVAWLTSGEKATLTIYLATNQTDITSFQIVPRCITGTALP
jgi:hypothetical protein